MRKGDGGWGGEALGVRWWGLRQLDIIRSENWCDMMSVGLLCRSFFGGDEDFGNFVRGWAHVWPEF